MSIRRFFIGCATTAAVLAPITALSHSPAEHKAAAKADAGHAAALGRPGDAKKVSRTIEVGMSDDMRFTPASVNVRQNETIRFVVKNTGKLKHELVLGTLAALKEHAAMMQKFPEMEHDDPNAVTVEPGRTGSLVWQFTRAGTFDFACLVPGHFEAGMKGRIAVSR
jgi:uncharacterized cupredoxin-like copper-binding protein